MSLKVVESLEGWLRASHAEHEAAGLHLESLCPGFRFTGVEATADGARTASFEFEGARFMFVPGGSTELGFVDGALERRSGFRPRKVDRLRGRSTPEWAA